jgi:tyrosine-protein kinase Etk/Wzc
MNGPVDAERQELPVLVTPPKGEDEIDLIDMCITLLQAKTRIALWTVAFFIVGVITSFVLKPVFTAETVILPPQQQSSAASILSGQLGALGSLSGVIKTPADTIMGLVESRTIADMLITQFKLQTVYHQKLLGDVRKQLTANTKVESSKDGLIHILVKDSDATRAAAIANAYVNRLHDINAGLAIGEAAQRRLFYDQQLSQENTALAAAEEALKETQEKTGVIQLSGQAQLTLSGIASLQAEIASREVQLSGTRTFATDQNPDVARQQQEIASLKNELASRENVQQHTIAGDVQVPSGRVPAVSLEYLRKQRDVRYHEALFELLLKQREAASLDEAKSAPLIQVVDTAIVPERKSGPSRKLIALGFALFGFLLSVLGVFFRSVLDGLLQDPTQAPRLHRLKDALKLGRS